MLSSFKQPQAFLLEKTGYLNTAMITPPTSTFLIWQNSMASWNPKDDRALMTGSFPSPNLVLSPRSGVQCGHFEHQALALEER